MISVSAMAIAFLTLGYFFKIKEIKSPEMAEVQYVLTSPGLAGPCGVGQHSVACHIAFLGFGLSLLVRKVSVYSEFSVFRLPRTQLC